MRIASVLAIGAVIVMAGAGAADAAVCKGRVAGSGSGQGLFGAGTQNARAAATADWQARAQQRYGRRFASFTKARGAKWDCAQNAMIQAKCVVTATACR